MGKIIIAAYALLLLSGAYFGGKVGSKISVIMGIASSVFVFIGLYLVNANPKIGYMLLTGVSGLLSVVFLMRLIKTGKMMPGGMLLILSAAFCAFVVSQLIRL